MKVIGIPGKMVMRKNLRLKCNGWGASAFKCYFLFYCVLVQCKAETIQMQEGDLIQETMTTPDYSVSELLDLAKTFK
jgi:hypothetical protein